MQEFPRVADKVALITGASRGLGRVLASFLGKQGYTLVVVARGDAELRGAAETFAAEGASVVSVAGDVSDPQLPSRLARAVEAWGRIDLLVNNASDLGGSPLPPLLQAETGRFLRVFEVNVLAPLTLTRELLTFLVRAHGLVVNVTSDAAIGGYPGWGVYGASKAALDLVTKTLAAELREQGVAVVSVDPGDMRTGMHQAAYPAQDISDRPLPEVTLPFWAWLLSQPPMAVSGGRYQAQGTIWEVPA